MKKEAFKEASLQNNNGTIVLYYYNKRKVRFNIGVTISQNKTRSGKFDEWDDNKQTINAKADNYHEKIQRINKWLEIANTYLREKYNEGYIVSGEELDAYLKQYSDDQQEKLFAELIPMYEQFHKRKKEEFTASKKIQSLKDYTSLLNAFYDYEVHSNTKILIKHIDEEWLRKFKLWLSVKRPLQYEKDGIMYDYKTKGQLVAKTLHKRFGCFSTFWKFLINKKLVTRLTVVEDFMRTIRPQKKQKVTLTIDEVYQLFNKNFDIENYNIVKDMFVFTCLTGLRYGDLKVFDSSFIKEHHSGKGMFYQRRAVKTIDSSGVTFRIPLCNTAIDILNKYENNIKRHVTSNTDLNSKLHKLLKLSGLFNALTEEKDKETGEYLARYDAISWHQGRDSFITNLVYHTPVNELMIYTGHSKISTLQGYIDFSRTIHMDFVNVAFNIDPKQQV